MVILHIIRKKSSIHTDLLMDCKVRQNRILEKKGVQLFHANKDSNMYSTIGFSDITDKEQASIVSEFFIRELKDYVQEKDHILIIGLGNRNSTPDALGPMTLDHVLVTRHLFSLGNVEEGYSNVCIFEPNVFGSTGINSVDLIRMVVDLVSPDLVIVIDSLCTSRVERMNRTIQITNSGISPGSGVFNNRGELSKKTLGRDVLAIGIPTVVDIHSLTKQDSLDNFIVTPKDIDYLIEQFSYLLGNSLNKVLHESFVSTK